MVSSFRRIRGQLRDHALGLREAHEALPWGERVVKVKNKVFVFLGRDQDRPLSVGVKLDASHASALALPGVTPMRYRLGKSGWVNARFEGASRPSLERLRAWVDESYELVAPKSLARASTRERAAKAERAAAARGGKKAAKKRTQRPAKPAAKAKAAPKPRGTRPRKA